MLLTTYILALLITSNIGFGITELAALRMPIVALEQRRQMMEMARLAVRADGFPPCWAQEYILPWSGDASAAIGRRGFDEQDMSCGRNRIRKFVNICDAMHKQRMGIMDRVHS